MMTPLKPATERRLTEPVRAIQRFLIWEIDSTDLSLQAAVNEFKGLANCCVRQDQWDWFTVRTRFRAPAIPLLRKTATTLGQPRAALAALKEQDALAVYALRNRLLELSVPSLARRFLGATDAWPDREFFHLPFLDAVPVIKNVLAQRASRW